MGRWLCEVVNIKNELIRGEAGCNIFEEREAIRLSSDPTLPYYFWSHPIFPTFMFWLAACCFKIL